MSAYQDALLAHYRAPHNRRSLAEPTARAAHRSPLCGDEITVELALDGDRIVDAAFTGRGCSIAVASASMLTDTVRGRTAPEALRIADALDELLARLIVAEGTAPLPEEMAPLRGVVPFPARHGCATMAWSALRAALASNSPAGG